MSSEVLAAFVTPGLFSLGVGGVALPILIHLFARRRFKRIRWAAVEFLISAERKNRRRLRLEEWILLALRCLAVALIALLVARPFLRSSSVAAALGGASRSDRIMVLDDSLSMSYESDGSTSFGRAKHAAHRLVDAVRLESPGDRMTILRMSAMDAPVVSGTYLDEAQTRDLRARLEALTVTQRSVDPAGVMAKVAATLEENRDIVDAVVYVLSDFQRTNWTPREGSRSPSGSSSILTPLRTWAQKERGLRLLFINVADADAVNRAVSALTLLGAQPVAGTPASLRAQVSNFSDQPVENLALRVAVGDITQPDKTIRKLAARQKVSVDLGVDFYRAGWDAVRVELPPDALPLDDTRYAAVEVVNAIRVLLVNGEPSLDPFNDEVTLLTTALRPDGDVFSGNELKTIDEAELEEANLASFHVVILANVYRVSELAVRRLERFARDGGGVMFFLGDQVDSDLYNTSLYREGEGLLPVPLSDRVRVASEAHLVVTDRLHPAMRGITREGDPLGIGRIPFFEFFGCEPQVVEPAARAEETPDELEDSAKPPSARVIARFDDADEHPAMVERPFGRGKVLLVTTSADKEWNQWPDHPTFVPVMMELIRHIARRGHDAAGHRVGLPIELPVDASEYESAVLVRTPGYPAEAETVVTARPARYGQGLSAIWEHTEAAGIYQFLLRKRTGGPWIQRVAVNVDPRESDLSMADEAGLRRAMPGVAFEYIEGLDALTDQAGSTRMELWQAVLLGLVVVLMGEQTLAWWWGRRR